MLWAEYFVSSASQIKQLHLRPGGPGGCSRGLITNLNAKGPTTQIDFNFVYYFLLYYLVTVLFI